MISKKQIKDIMADYQLPEDMIMDGNERYNQVLRAVYNLPTSDMIIFLLYTYHQSSRKTGAILGVSHNIILREVRRIREEVKKNYNQLIKEDNTQL